MDRTTRRKLLRLGVLIVVLAGLFALGRITGISDHLTKERVREVAESAGSWGVVIFIGAFAVGELMHVPGMVFVAAALLAYGKIWGFGLALVASIISVTVSFVFVRAIGGKAIVEIDRPFVKRMMARLEARPVTTVIALRIVFWLAPALNYALALSSIRLRHFVVGSAIGLFPPLVAATLLFDWIAKRF